MHNQKYAILNNSEDDDSNEIRVGRVFTQGDIPYDVHLTTPYGFDHGPPDDALVIMSGISNDCSSFVGTASDPNNRFKNLKKTEVKLGNPYKNTYAYFDKDGNIVINSTTKIIINSGANADITINGNATIQATGNVSVTAGTYCSVNAPNINLTGATTLTGAVAINGAVTITGLLVVNGKNFSSHVHTGVQNGPGNTGNIL